MKTFFERLIIQIENIAHPAGGWFKNNAQRKRIEEKERKQILSPDSFNVRGIGSKKSVGLRRTPAP